MATITPYVTSFLNTASYEPTTGLNLPPLSAHTDGIVASMYKKMETEYPLHVLLPFIYHQLARSHEEPRPPVPAGWSENTSTAGGISKINYLHQDSDKQISLIRKSLDPNQANAGTLFSFTDTLILGVGASISYRVTTEIASSPGPDSPGQLSIRIKFNPDLMAIAQAFFGNETPSTQIPTLVYKLAQRSGLIPAGDLTPATITPSGQKFSEIKQNQRDPRGKPVFEAYFLSQDGGLTSGVITITCQNFSGQPIMPSLSVETGLLPFLNDLHDHAVNPHGEY